jgi:predicted esterase
VTKPRPIRTAEEHSIEVPRTARYYLMGNAPGGDLWIVLHGFGQLAGDFIEYFVELNDGSRVIAAPEALNRYYTASLSVPSAERPVGATWMTREFREAEMRDYVRYLDLLHGELTRRFRPRKTIVVGFSQGGATASRWVARGAASIDALVLWGATFPPDLDIASARQRLAATRIAIVVGRTDQYISPEALERERQRLSEATLPVDFIEYDAGHSIKRGVLKDVASRIAGS